MEYLVDEPHRVELPCLEVALGMRGAVDGPVITLDENPCSFEIREDDVPARGEERFVEVACLAHARVYVELHEPPVRARRRADPENGVECSLSHRDAPFFAGLARRSLSACSMASMSFLSLESFSIGTGSRQVQLKAFTLPGTLTRSSLASAAR